MISSTKQTKDKQTNYTYASVDKDTPEKPPLPARLNPLPPIPYDPSQLADDASSYDYIGVDLKKSAISSELTQTNDTYASVDKDTTTTEKPPLPPRLVCYPLPPTPSVDCQSTEAELLSTYDSIGPDLTKSVTELSKYNAVDGAVAGRANYTYASIDKKTEPKKKPPSLYKLPPIPVEHVDDTKLDSTYDTIGPSLSQSSVPAEPLLSHPPVEEQASSTVIGTDQTSYTYASVDMSQKAGDDNPAKKLPPPKPARKSPPPMSDSLLPDSCIYSEVNDKHPPDSQDNV